MRIELVSLAIAGLAVLTTGSSRSPEVDDNTVTTAAPTVVVQHVSLPLPIPDEAAMALVGAALIGVAAAVRRAV